MPLGGVLSCVFHNSAKLDTFVNDTKQAKASGLGNVDVSEILADLGALKTQLQNV